MDRCADLPSDAPKPTFCSRRRVASKNNLVEMWKRLEAFDKRSLYIHWTEKRKSKLHRFDLIPSSKARKYKWLLSGPEPSEQCQNSTARGRKHRNWRNCEISRTLPRFLKRRRRRQRKSLQVGNDKIYHLGATYQVYRAEVAAAAAVVAAAAADL